MIYEYNLTDHLGNTRITFGDSDTDGDADILQENHYYPFGMLMTMTSSPSAAPPNNYLYNGKELQDELDLGWYDYGARMYDASIGRWNGVDALAEKYSGWSPYRYGFNNPIRYIDPSGNLETDYYNLKGKLVKRVEDGSSEKVLVLTKKSELAAVEEVIDAGHIGPVASNAALDRMDESYETTEETGNEAGFAAATDGDVSTLAIGDGGEVNTTPKRTELLEKGKTVVSRN